MLLTSFESCHDSEIHWIEWYIALLIQFKLTLSNRRMKWREKMMNLIRSVMTYGLFISHSLKHNTTKDSHSYHLIEISLFGCSEISQIQKPKENLRCNKHTHTHAFVWLQFVTTLSTDLNRLIFYFILPKKKKNS